MPDAFQLRHFRAVIQAFAFLRWSVFVRHKIGFATEAQRTIQEFPLCALCLCGFSQIKRLRARMPDALQLRHFRAVIQAFAFLRWSVFVSHKFRFCHRATEHSEKSIIYSEFSRCALCLCGYSQIKTPRTFSARRRRPSLSGKDAKSLSLHSDQPTCKEASQIRHRWQIAISRRPGARSIAPQVVKPGDDYGRFLLQMNALHPSVAFLQKLRCIK